MKNMRMKGKLMISFLLVAVFTMVAGAVGIVEMRTLSANGEMLHSHTQSTNSFIGLQRNVQAQRAAYRGAVMMSMAGVDYSDELYRLEMLDTEFRRELSDLLARKHSGEVHGALTGALTVYDQQYAPARHRLTDTMLAGDDHGAAQTVRKLIGPIEELQRYLDDATQQALEEMAAARRRDVRASSAMTAAVVAAVAAAVGLAVFFAFYISHIIAAPLERMAREVRKLQVGNFDVHPEIDQEDEVGVVDKALWKIVHTSLEQQEGIVRMSQGDFTAFFPVRSPQDTMNKSLNALTDTFNHVMNQVQETSRQVSVASGQMSQNSQMVAQGASEQAATMEQLNRNLVDIQAMAEQTSSTAATALEEVEDAGRYLAGCNEEMKAMLRAMQDLDEKSAGISTVTKVISDLAYQINILALNAAVEAARAGQYGKGFMVVADEVRNLAHKSTQAVQETADLIRACVGSVQEGIVIVGEVESRLQATRQNAEQNQVSIARMARYSLRQKESITEVSGGVAQLSHVVQANTANAEQAAATSQQLVSQVMALDEVLGRFQLRKTVRSRSAGEQTMTL